MTRKKRDIESEHRITDIQGVQLNSKAGGRTLIRVKTDTGLTGYGEAGGRGPAIRGHLRQIESLLEDEDPVTVERHYDRMMNRQHPYRPHVPAVSGVDIALWDLTGKIYDCPVSELLLGRFRSEIPYYINVGPEDLTDPESCREWADELAGRPHVPSAVKFSFDEVLAEESPRRRPRSNREKETITQTELQAVKRAAENVRDALQWEMDFIAHCHNEWDLPSAIGLSEAIGPAKPLWLEDPLPTWYSENWKTLKQDSPCPILVGEKLEGPREFEPFVLNGVVDVLQPDLIFAGGLTGGRKIAELTDRHYIPLTAHNTGGLVQNAATVHFGASVRNFWMTETMVTVEGYERCRQMGGTGLEIKDGAIQVPNETGLGVTVEDDVVEANLAEGESFWE